MNDIEMENEQLCALPFLNREYFASVCMISKSPYYVAICEIRQEHGART